MDYPHFDSEYEIWYVRGQRSPDWEAEYDFYHNMKSQWVEIINLQREWWERWRDHFKGRRDKKVDTIKDYTRRYGLRFFVETGTHVGETSWALKDIFEKIFTVEIEPDLYEKATRLFDGTNVQTFYGDSAEVLPSMVGHLGGQPALFWIDAHWSRDGPAPDDRQSPVKAELEFLLGLEQKRHVIMVDDARYFGGVAERDTQAEGYPHQDWVKELAVNAGYEFFVANDIIRLTPKDPS